MPVCQKAAIRAIDVDEESRDWAVAGYNVVLHLGGIELDRLRLVDESAQFCGDLVC